MKKRNTPVRYTKTSDNKLTRATSTAIASLALLLSACATNDPYQKTGQGALAGAAAGAAIGSLSDNPNAVVYAALVGAVAGAAAGNYMDRQQQEIENAFYREIENRDMQIYRLQNETLKIALDSSASFDSNSFAVKPALLPVLDRLSRLMKQYEKTAVHIIGHTDSGGSDDKNRMLSQQRAAAVATVILDTGINISRFNIEGRGEFQPRKSNRTLQGRQANRRVEIYLKPIVQGREALAFVPPGRRT